MTRRIRLTKGGTTMEMRRPIDSRVLRVLQAARRPPALVPAPVPRRPARFGKKAGLAAAAVLVGALFLVGAVPRWQRQAELNATSDQAQSQLRRVSVASARQTAEGELTLPATLLANQWAELHARVGGYLKIWYTDIGTPVQAGQLLAEIQTPELDEELNQGRAQLAQSEAEVKQAETELEEARAALALARANVVRTQANVAYAESLLKRNRVLVAGQAIARQELEDTQRNHDFQQAQLQAEEAEARRVEAALSTRQAIIQSRQATVQSRFANVQRLRELQAFQRVTAPFDGVITRRTAEVGMLVTAGGSGQRPLFSLAQTTTLRVQVPVPQTHAAALRVGDEFIVTVPEAPNRNYSARVARTASAVDPTSRTLLVELELPNAERELLAGTFAQVKLGTRPQRDALMVPANALLLRNDGPHVAVVSGGGNVRLQKVTLGRDFGTRIEVIRGLQGYEVLVINPADDLRDGEHVEIVARPDPGADRLAALPAGK